MYRYGRVSLRVSDSVQTSHLPPTCNLVRGLAKRRARARGAESVAYRVTKDVHDALCTVFYYDHVVPNHAAGVGTLQRVQSIVEFLGDWFKPLF